MSRDSSGDSSASSERGPGGTAQPSDAACRGGERPTRVRWTVFSLAFSTSWLLYLHRYLFSFIKPTLSKEWGLSNTELGQLDSAFSLSYTVFQFPLGVVGDLFGVHLVLSLMILLWCSGLGLLACSSTARGLWYAQSLVGAGQSAVYACLTRVARTWFPPKSRTTMQGTVSILAGRLGALSSSLVFSSLLLGVIGMPWRTAVGTLVALGAVQLVLFAVFFRNSPRQHPHVNDAEADLIEGTTDTARGGGTADSRVEADLASKSPAANSTTGNSPAAASGTAESKPGWRQMLRSMSGRSFLSLSFLTVQSILSTFADNIYANWIPQFLSQVHKLQYKSMGVYASLPLLGGAVAGLLGGYLNDRCIAWSGNKRWSRAAVAIAGKGIAAAVLFAALTQYERPYVFCGLLFFVKLFGDWSLVSMHGAVADIGGRGTASLFAWLNTLAGIGMIAAPLVFGYVADHHGWWNVFMLVAVTYVFCALTWFGIDCTRPVMDRLAK